MNNERGDLILPQGTYAFIQDGANGNVEVVVGPHKTSLADTDSPVVQDERTMRFSKMGAGDAIATWKTANERQYIVLKNPVKGTDTIKYPQKGKQQAPDLSIGNKINVQGPGTFALFPGQFAHAIDGHDLRSNDYLVIRVYNEESAKADLENAVVKTTDEGDDTENKSLYEKKDLVTGKLMIIKGVDVSFYIPPTGIEVVKNENNKYVRQAVTLERLEYCILLDQNGDKRYIQGPSVVFPKPTEEFIETDNTRKFKALELNQNMGIYVKVIADYKEGKKEFKTGDELFITGKEQKIYYPRPEHALISYDSQKIHYAVALPEGEGRYVLNKDTGEVKLVRGPKMFMADPRTEVIVKRVLDKKMVRLMYPDNRDAADYNQRLELEIDEQGGDEAFLGSRFSNIASSAQTRGSALKSKAALAFDTLGDMSRSSTYTKPRTVTLDNKYEGAVKIGIWPGYAVQVVRQNGKRQVVEGPETVLLEYDEYLDVLALSTNKPKTDHELQKTVYLQTKNNVVSDIVSVETEDFVKVNIRLSYRVNFIDDNSIWFNVSNYVKLMTQHLRSLIRNEVKRHKIEKFNENSTDIIRDVVLGTKEDKTARGKLFKENNAFVYDVEVLKVEIDDYDIAELLQGAQRNTVRKNLDIRKREQDLEYTTKVEGFKRDELVETQKTAEVVHGASLKEIDQRSIQRTKNKEAEKAVQELLNEISDAEIAREAAQNDETLRVDTKETELRIKEVKEKMDAVGPKLVEALSSLGSVSLTEILAKNLTYRTHSIFGDNGGMETLLETLKGTPMESQIKTIIAAGKVNGGDH